MLDIYIDQINSTNGVLEFHIDEKENFNKVKTLLTQLERCSHFVDSSIAPFKIDVFLQTNKIAVTSKFLYQSYKSHGNFMDLLKINGIELHPTALNTNNPNTDEGTPLIGETKHETFLQKNFFKLILRR
jgi:YbbR domain-containing protein